MSELSDSYYIKILFYDFFGQVSIISLCCYLITCKIKLKTWRNMYYFLVSDLVKLTNVDDVVNFLLKSIIVPSLPQLGSALLNNYNIY